jgi:hypothetical protein
LQDAVSAGQQKQASLIIASGGVLSSSYGKERVFQASRKGDVQALKMLFEYAGVKVITA